MIDIVNNKIVIIDDMGNMTVLEDESLETLYHSMKSILGDIIIDINIIEPVEDIYYYIVEKIYKMPDYTKWNDTEFKEKPKQKLLIAFNKFLYDEINRRTK